MAYSKTPQFNSHQLVRLPVSGTQYPHGTLSPSVGMRYVNCAPRTIEQFGTDPERILVKRPYFTAGASASVFGDMYRGCGYAFGNTYYGNVDKIYKNSETSAAFTLSYNGTGSALTRVYFEEAVLAGVSYLVVLEEGYSTNKSKLHLYNVDTSTLSSTTDLGFMSVGAPVFLNGYLFIAEHSTQRIYNSEVGSLTTWTLANNFIDAEMYGDDIVNLAISRNHLVVFGNRTIEFFYDGAVEVGSPLVRQESYATKVGIKSTAGSFNDEYVYIGNTIYFIGTVNGRVGLYELENFKASLLHNDYVETLLNNGTSIGYNYLFVLNYAGELTVVMYVSRIISGVTTNYYFVYHPREKVWSQMVIPSTEGAMTTFTQILGGLSGTGFIGTVDGDTTYMLCNNIETSAVSIEASWTTDFFDGGVDSMKHFKYVDVLGSIGTESSTNVITLSYCKDYTPVTFTNATTISRAADQFYTTRFRNLGRARRISLRVTATGAAPIAIKGLDIAYNLGVY